MVDVVYDGPGVTYDTPGIVYQPSSLVPVTTASVENWSINGVSLQTHAYNIETWGGSRQAPPPKRGANVLIPHRAGAKYVPKVADQRIITLGMWVVGADIDGAVRDRTKFESNWRMLRRLLWTEDSQVTLSKSFYDDISNTTVTASAQVEVVGGLEPSMFGRMRAAFTVDLQLAEPYFYSDSVNYSFSGSQSILMLGDVKSQKVNVEFLGSATNPKLTNSANNISVQYLGSLADSNEFVSINADTYTAFSGVVSPPSIGTNVADKIVNSGSYAWMLIGGKAGSLTLTGGGLVNVSVSPAWI